MSVRRGVGRWIVVGIAAALVPIVGLATRGSGSSVHAATTDFASLLGTRPYVPLFTEANNCSDNKQLNSLTGSALDRAITDMSTWYVHVHAESSNTLPLGTGCMGSSSSTLASKLVSSGLWASNYRNGTYVSQSNLGGMNFSEAALLEQQAPLSIGTFWPGDWQPSGRLTSTSPDARLVSPIDETQTAVEIVATPLGDRPPNTNATWPWPDSRGTGLGEGAYSSDTHNFVSWVRVDDEMMQVVQDPSESKGIVTLRVVRGIWGTRRASHDGGVRAMSPVYIGNANAQSSDTVRSGAPVRDDTHYPLRYSIKIWQPAGAGWIADRIKKTFGAGMQGYDAVWLDISGCSQYNTADAAGDQIFGWDDPHAQKLTSAHWGDYQKQKLATLRQRLPGVTFTGNSLLNGDACNNDLLSNSYDAGALENYMKPGHSTFDWPSEMQLTYKVMSGNWPAMFWVRWNYDFSTDGAAIASYKRFAYGSMLLAYRKTATRFQFGGAWGVKKPDELFFWKLGSTQTTSSSLADVALSDGLYRRDFDNAVVIVNPSGSSITKNLGGTFYDVVNQTGGNPTPVTSITVPAKDAAFLLRPLPADSDTVPPTTSVNDISVGAVVGDRIALQGDASDNVGVEAVGVAIQDTATSLWWHDDGTWGSSRSLAATLSAPAATSTGWSLIWDAPAAGSYMVEAAAADAAGNVDTTPATTTFSVDPLTPSPSPSPSPSASPPPSPSPSPSPDPGTPPVTDSSPPTSTISSPADGAIFGGRNVKMNGTAVDDRAIGAVDISILNADTGKWLLRDGSWTGSETWMAAALSPLSPNATVWSRDWKAPRNGTFRVFVRSTDTTGNVESAPPSVSFTAAVTSRHLTTRIASTTPATVRAQWFTLSGTATGVGITRVTYSIRDIGARRWARENGRLCRHRVTLRARVLDPGSFSAVWRSRVHVRRPGAYEIVVTSWDRKGTRAGSHSRARFRVL